MEVSGKEVKMEGQYMIESSQRRSDWRVVRDCEENRVAIGVISTCFGSCEIGIFQINSRDLICGSRSQGERKVNWGDQF